LLLYPREDGGGDKCSRDRLRGAKQDLMGGEKKRSVKKEDLRKGFR